MTHPVLRLRMGAIGHRTIARDAEASLEAAVRAILDLCAKIVTDLAGERAVRKAYARSPLTLSLLSPLARGADRIAARAALTQGFSLQAVLPFVQAEYERDFPAETDLAEFRDLLSACRGWLSLDGTHSKIVGETGRAYEAAGRFVVRHVDILLAIWDGNEDAQGRGGTAEIVRHALQTGVPVWHIPANGVLQPRFLMETEDMRAGDAGSAVDALGAYLRQLIVPPPPARRHHHGITDRVAHLRQGHAVAPLDDFLSGEAKPASWPWTVYSGFMRRIGDGSRRALRARESHDDPIARYWFERFARADADANANAARYRSSYLWVILFTALSVAMGALSSVFSLLRHHEPESIGFGVLEFACLTLVLIVILLGRRNDWHENSIELRVLAELCRKQQVLAPLGWNLSIVALRPFADAPTRYKDTPSTREIDRGAWVPWLFAAFERGAPMPTGTFTTASIARAREAILSELVNDQIEYHSRRVFGNTRSAAWLQTAGGILFVAVAVSVVGRRFLDLLDKADSRNAIPVLLGALATILPAFSGALVGLLSYAELPMLARQSSRMLNALTIAKARIERLPPERPLLSQDLGAEAAGVASVMLQDLDGWASLFRVKGIEA